MYQVYLDDNLLYDPRVEELKIINPMLDLEVNKSGSFRFKIYDTHPKYGSIQRLTSVISVYRGDTLKFRGRVLNDTKDMYNGKTVECEGSLAMLNDSLQPPYDWSGSIIGFLEMLMDNHNDQTVSGKAFGVGTVTVTDPNDFIVRSDINYNTTWKVIEEKLISSLGGYIVYEYRPSDGMNIIHYLEDSDYMTQQVIQLGDNLQNVVQERSGDDIATAIIARGARLEDEEGNEYFVDLTSVAPGGVPYVYNQEAVDRYGWIYKYREWENVTLPENLLVRANQALAEAIQTQVTIDLSAVDKNMLDVNIDAFNIFEYVKVKSSVHELDDYYLIKKLSLDLMNPRNNSLQVGTTYATFTEEQARTGEIIRVIRSDYVKNDAVTLIKSELTTLSSNIQQTAEEIRLEVSENYTQTTEFETYRKSVSTEFEQTKSAFEFGFNQLTQTINNNQGDTDAELELIRKYIRFEDGNIVLGESGNQVTLRLENDILGFYQSGNQVAYLSDNKLFVTDGEFINSLKLGSFAFEPRTNGNLSFGKVV